MSIQAKNLIEHQYLRRARFVAALLRLAPFVRMIGLTGSLAAGKATAESDIDFFIVAKPGRLWSARFFATCLVHLIGMRRYGRKISGRICLNCYQTSDHLEVSPKNAKNAKDYANILFLFSTGNLTRKFFKENFWINEKKFEFLHQSYKKGLNDFWSYPVRWVFEGIFEVIFNNPGEQLLRRFQLRKILKNPITLRARAGQIYISDQELRFHPEKS